MPKASSRVRGLDLESVLALPCLAGATVVAGRAGLGRRVTRLNVMEVPDIAAWVKPDELLLTTGYALRQELDTWAQLIADLAHTGLAGVAVKVDRYIDVLPSDMLEEADRLGLPVIELPAEVAFDDVISQVLEAVLETDRDLLTRSDETLRSLLESCSPAVTSSCCVRGSRACSGERSW
ncbi:PucR family transcriptional regulator ligand-binding domain-containing protein [Nocardioides sp.]|uniref:PucR family transcriptional regulator ligand-binding domain-containing protein n=1 Tax=Nocardioides sp. TaxID=35761 RepID=UPI002604057B|nr:PucR family transcriptional regulator ligand-binding domain-containing protein [Nocardioides sp.]MDI6909364.1 PucR family transcriptional regulator ligand-binding domain-containing protein [Nocardioides sp.]